MTLITHSPEETRALAQQVAKQLHKGDCIALIGDMGVGKTVFVQGLAKGLGITAQVTSPTFSLMNMYAHLYHFDLYRLGQEEIFDLGFDEYFYDENSISVVEWPLTELLPEGFVEIRIERGEEDTRIITLPDRVANIQQNGDNS